MLDFSQQGPCESPFPSRKVAKNNSHKAVLAGSVLGYHVDRHTPKPWLGCYLVLELLLYQTV